MGGKKEYERYNLSSDFQNRTEKNKKLQQIDSPSTCVIWILVREKSDF